MLRVFVDTYDKNFSEDLDSFNVQHVSFEKLIFSKEKLYIVYYIKRRKFYSSFTST